MGEAKRKLKALAGGQAEPAPFRPARKAESAAPDRETEEIRVPVSAALRDTLARTRSKITAAQQEYDLILTGAVAALGIGGAVQVTGFEPNPDAADTAHPIVLIGEREKVK